MAVYTEVAVVELSKMEENLHPNYRSQQRARKNSSFLEVQTQSFSSLDYYTQLGVSRNAKTAEIRSSYHKLCKAHHPDRIASRRSFVNTSTDSSYLNSSSTSSPSFYDIDGIDEDDADVDDATDIENKENFQVLSSPITTSSSSTSATSSCVQTSPPSPSISDDTYHQDRFALISQAHSILSDSVQRAKYDLEQGFVENTKESKIDLYEKQKHQAEGEIALMKETYESKLKFEQERKGGGIVITSALYGPLKSYIDTSKPIQKGIAPSKGTLIDAKVQLQCKVIDSELRLDAGISKALTCRGLYDPSKSESERQYLRLCVRYEFRGQPHQALVHDLVDLRIPTKAHKYSEKRCDKRLRKLRKTMKRRRLTVKDHTIEATRNEEEKRPAATSFLQQEKEQESKNKTQNTNATPSASSFPSIFAVSIVAASVLLYFFIRKRS